MNSEPITHTSSSGLINLTLTAEQARTGYHSGPCDQDIAYLRQDPAIKAQLDAIGPIILANELKGYGAWDDTELLDHNANLDRYLWLACSDIVEELRD